MNGMLRAFPFSEEELHTKRQETLAKIVLSQYRQSYDQWILQGAAHESFDSINAIGIFPTLSGKEDTLLGKKNAFQFGIEDIVIGKGNRRPIEECYADILSLPFSDNMREYENKYFFDLKGSEDILFRVFLMMCAKDTFPSSAVLFSRSSISGEESVSLISHRFVPPSATYQQVKDQARLCIAKRS